MNFQPTFNFGESDPSAFSTIGSSEELLLLVSNGEQGRRADWGNGWGMEGAWSLGKAANFAGVHGFLVSASASKTASFINPGNPI